MAQEEQAEIRQTYLCPCFKEFILPGGFCSLDRLPRQDNYTLLSCSFNGNAELCLRKGDPKIRENLKLELDNHAAVREAGAKYFKELLKKSG
jgi:hypothetical protein